MPPKPRPVPRPIPPPKDGAATPAAKETPSASASMPPPPVPAPPLGILEGEITALSTCLQNAVVKTGQIYGFYTDVKRLGIQKYAPHPPRTLIASLGREIEKYDQLCDAMESHLLRAIAVLQRDLAREEQRLKAEEEAAAAARKQPSPSGTITAPTTPLGSPSQTHTDTLPDGTPRPKTTTTAITTTAPTPARRQSTISLSSLQRPAFPHKLDLSASALRIHPEELLPSGLSSPVTLAPRSARASLPPDLVMAALSDAANRPVDIDLTVDTDIDMTGGAGGSGEGMGPRTNAAGLGSSADKPIELDLDIDMEFFGEGAGAGPSNAGPNMFGTQGAQSQQGVKPKEEVMDIDILKALQEGEPSATGEDIFASLGGASSSGTNAPGPSAPGTSHSQKAPSGAPSPGAFLASLGAGTSQAADNAAAGSSMGTGQDGQINLQNFDISALNSNFFSENSGGAEMDMMGIDDLFNMTANPAPNTENNNSGSS
ncbi:hypothetical protein BD413DRAFT_700419 [Trametes elegans]|nr:hypothetical protein BD413DRAFT_700419 [Trametes elegans]